MRILLIEDNKLHADLLRDGLRKIAGADIVRLVSERAFHDAWPQIESEPPDVVLIDLMLRFDIPRRDPESQPSGTDIYDAGIRCMRRLKESEKTRDTPIILYSVVSRSAIEPHLQNLPEGVTFMEKTPDVSAVVSLIRDVTSAARSRK